MLIYKTKYFSRWAAKQKLADEKLRQAGKEVALDVFDADLGGYAYKKRVSRPGMGKRSGYRVVLAYKRYDKVIYLYGYAKNKRASISEQELVALRKLTQDYMAVSSEGLMKLIEKGELEQIA